MAVLALKKHNRLPLPSLEAPVDAFRLGLHLGEQIVIALDVRPTRSSNLHEREFSLIAGILFEEPLNSQKALQNAFGVIDAVDADAHECRLHAQTSQQAGTFEVVKTVIVVSGGIVVGVNDDDGKRPVDFAMLLAERLIALPDYTRLVDVI